MSYDDKALRQTYSFPAATISGATTTYPIKGPTGRRGRVIAVHGAVTTVIVGAPAIQVGVSGTLAKFANLSISAAAAGSALATETMTRNAAGIPDYIDTTDTALVTVTTGTSGVVVPSVTIDWF